MKFRTRNACQTNRLAARRDQRGFDLVSLARFVCLLPRAQSVGGIMKHIDTSLSLDHRSSSINYASTFPHGDRIGPIGCPNTGRTAPLSIILTALSQRSA
jgi:hypothetical protein